jgi:hypothetical protein
MRRIPRVEHFRSSGSANQTPQHISMAVSSHLISVAAERSYKGPRFFWTVCSARNPDELLSWGDCATRELALESANKEIERLESGLTTGGRVRNSKAALTLVNLRRRMSR